MRLIVTLLLYLTAAPLAAQGLSERDIVQVQGLLADMGYRAELGTVDGVMGPGTAAAITSFQRETGKKVTGTPSRALIEQLRQLHGQGWDRGEIVATGPSFDCGRAGTAVERTICADTRLSRLDRDVAQAYAAALARGGDRNAVRADQKRWLGLRNDCGNDRRCIDNAMTGQIYILNKR